MHGIRVDHRKGSALISYLLYVIIGVLVLVFTRQTLLQPKEARKRALHRGTD